MARKADIGSSNAQYTRSYSDLRGVDFSSDPSQVSVARPSYLANMYRDYDSEHGAAIETIPGYRRLFHFGGTVHGIWGYSSSQDEDGELYAVVHAGTKLFTFKLSEKDSGLYEERFDGLCDCDSTAFLQNNNFYICDGTCIYVMKSDLSVSSIVDEAYTPITYLHGAPYEQKNMINDKFVNRDTVISDQYICPNVSGVKHSADNIITNSIQPDKEVMTSDERRQFVKNWLSQFVYTKKTMNVSSGYSYEYLIKGYIGGDLDELTVLSTNANTTYGVATVYGSGSNDIKIRFADEFCKKIKRVIAGYQEWLEPYEVPKVDEDGDYVYDGNGNQMYYTRYNEHTGYSLDQWRELFPGAEEIYEYGGVNDIPMRGGWYQAKMILYDPCEEILSVKVNEQEIVRYEASMQENIPELFYMPVSQEVKEKDGTKWYVSYINVYAKEEGSLKGATVEVLGKAKSVVFNTTEEIQTIHTDYITANTEYEGTAIEAILGCAIATTFDGRVFLTGNPKLPNTVFYSCRDLSGYNNPTYWGVYNYFNDGEGNEPNVALLATSNVLMVLKRSTIQGSAIYYHVGAEGLDDVVPRIYPSTPGVAGVGCEGAAINFLDDAVFISERGLEGVSKEQLNLERTVGHRSSNVDRYLRRGMLSKAKMCRFGGYLCVFDGMGNVFLGDSRQLFQGVDGSLEYEWYYLEGLGDYEGDYELYRTVTQYPEILREDIPEGETLEGATLLGKPLLVDETAKEVFPGALYTGEAEITVDGTTYSIAVKYTDQNGAYFLCDTDGERTGGHFSPARIGATIDGSLFFGTQGGAVCCMNTDKRGTPVGGEPVEKEEIHRSWYSFAGHRFFSGLALKSDNCGVPHLTKRTTRKTCVAKLKTMQGSSVSVKIRTDREPWHEVTTSLAATAFDFSNMEFDNFSFSMDSDTIVTIKDKEKKWVEKQFLLYSGGWCRPFGLHNMTYNYEIQGRVKKG